MATGLSSRAKVFVVAMLALVIAGACSRNDSTRSPTATATPSTPPTPPPPRDPTRFGVSLIETTPQQVRPLYEGTGYASVEGFTADGESVWVYLPGQQQSIRFGLDGKEQQRAPGFVSASGRTFPTCRNLQGTPPVAEINGRRYEVACGSFSADSARMIYEVQTGTVDVGSGYLVAVRSMWVLDLASGERKKLQDGLRDCGGCDSRVAPAWSRSGRYVIYSEFYSGQGGSRVYLSNLETGDTR